MADNIEPISHLEKVITGNVEPISHLEQVIAQYGAGGGTSDYDALKTEVEKLWKYVDYTLVSSCVLYWLYKAFKYNGKP